MKSKLSIVVLLTILMTAVLFFVFSKKETSLISSSLKQEDTSTESSPLSESPAFTQPQNNPPRSFQFNESTDLEKELESIDPQVLDTDFE